MINTIFHSNQIPIDSHNPRIKGENQPKNPILSRGGILADDMGLGKTLTMLATIVRFKRDGQMYASNGCKEGKNKSPRTRGTLVIVQLSRMIYLANCSFLGG